MFQMKEQDKTPEEELGEVEIDNLSNKEFKVMIIKMIKELGRRMDEHSEKFYKALESIKKKQIEPKNTITEMKYTLEGINNKLNDTEERISELEDRVVEITEKRIKRNKESIRVF